MKKILITIALLATCAGVFAQGKVTFNNTDNLITFTNNSSYMIGADWYAGLGGAAVPNNPASIPSGVTVEAGLYAGTSSSSLALQTTAVVDSGTGISAGLVGSPSGGAILLKLSGIAGGQQVYFQVRVWDAPYATYEAAYTAAQGGGVIYLGESNEFSMTPGSSITYPGLYAGGSTWTDSEPILIGIVPEPAAITLLGLGAAALLIFRRRK